MIKTVLPYIYPNQLNFKDRPFRVWKSLNPKNTVKGWYPKLLHGLWFRRDIFPTLWQTRNEVRLVFVQPVSLYFDAGFSILTHEVIPIVWDCWPCYYDKMEKWLKRHRVRTAFFTSRQEMTEMQKRCPNIKMMWCPEAIDESLYTKGKELKDRTIDLLEFGRSNGRLFSNTDFTDDTDKKITNSLILDRHINHVTTKVNGMYIYTDEQLYQAMADARITICLPRCITDPDMAQGIETLTQRYWEAMLSRMIIVGHAPQELIDICEYNPVIEIKDNGLMIKEQILDILNHTNDYQELVDRNRTTAIKLSPWSVRIKQIVEFLQQNGYSL